jgi:hypothetical protein
MDQLIQLIEEVEKAKKNPFINVRHSHEYMSESHRVKMRGEWDIHAHIFKIELPEKVYGKQISREQQEFTRLDRRIGKLSRLASRTVEHFITLRPGTDRKACEEGKRLKFLCSSKKNVHLPTWNIHNFQIGLCTWFFHGNFNRKMNIFLNKDVHLPKEFILIFLASRK